jgi:uncharacterized membrane protein
LYDVVLYAHILAAMTWVGGGIWAQAYALRAERSSDPMDVVRFGQTAAWVGTRVSLPASLVVVLAGIFMTLQRWSFTQAWVAIALALWILSAVLGAVYIGPRLEKAAAAFEAEGPTSPTGIETNRRLFLVSRLELVGFLVIVALMVFKPGA